jgi:hypothetical protein
MRRLHGGGAGDSACSVRPGQLWDGERKGMTSWAHMSLSRERVVRRVFWAIRKYVNLHVGPTLFHRLVVMQGPKRIVKQWT